MNTNNTDIVIIDDGINYELYAIGKLQLDIEIDMNLNINNRTIQHRSSNSHGTTCAAIIKKYAPESKISSIKILNEKNGRGAKYQLIKAIQWCSENGIRLVNLSLGTIDFRDFIEIRNCVNQAAEKGLIVVAACNNNNVYTVPACLSNTIGVNCKKSLIDGEFLFNKYPYTGVDISASGRHYIIDIRGNGIYTEPVNSYASAFITSQVYKLIKETPDISLENTRTKLYYLAKNSNEDEYNPNFCINVDWNCQVNEVEFSDTFCINNGVKFWNKELFDNTIKSNNVKIKDIDIPIIAVYSDRSGNINDKDQELHSLFSNDGYFCVMLSTEYKDIANGYQYLSDNIYPPKMLTLVYSKYNCDVIILKVEDNQRMRKIEQTVKIDMKICILDEKYFIGFNNSKESVTLEEEKNNQKNEIRNVYAMILDYFKTD